MQFFNNLKTLYKVLSLAAVLLGLTGMVAFIGYHASYQINARSDAQDISQREVNMIHTLYETAMEINTAVDDVAVDFSRKNIDHNVAIAKETGLQFDKYLGLLKETADAQQQLQLKRIEEAFKAYVPAVDAVFKQAYTMSAVPGEDEISRLNATISTNEDFNDALKLALKEAVEYSVKQGEESSAAATHTYEKSSAMLQVTSLSALLLGLVLSFLLATYSIAKPLQQVVGNLNSLINNDLDVEIQGAQRKDEVGDLAKAAQTFKDVLIKNKAMAEAEKLEVEKKLHRQQRVAELISNFDLSATETVSTVASASTQLSQTAENMSAIAGSTNQQSIEVASASEQASHNVQSVASAAEEMAATVQEISRQIAMSNDIVRQAQTKAEEADNSSRELVDMSRSVGTIATLIEDIAGQINLLALNATIESARSGEAGKGFAVVANEVKNLATQTAKATEQIRQQLDGVQKTAVSVADMLGGVRESISEVSQSSAAIAAAVEEQSAATHEIVSNMNTATQGVEQINNGIFVIKGGTDSTTAATREVLDAAKMLSTQAEKMDAEVKKFLSNIQAA